MAGKAKQSAKQGKPANQQQKKTGPQKKKDAPAKAASAASAPGKGQPPRFRALGQIYNPFSHTGPVPVAEYEGKAVCLRSSYQTQISANASADTLLLFQNLGHGVKLMGRVVIDATPNPGDGFNSFAGNFLQESATQGGPTSGRAMRLGVEVQNTTKRVDMGGRVFTLVSSERQFLPADASSMTQAQWQALADGIVTNPKTIGYNGAVLESPVRLYSTPHTQKSYLGYGSWTGNSEGVDDYYKHATNANGSMLDMPMSVIWVALKANAQQNSYNFRVLADYHVRYGATNVLSTKMAHAPLASDESLHAAAVTGSELGRGSR
jgi:hypothetical protein